MISECLDTFKKDIYNDLSKNDLLRMIQSEEFRRDVKIPIRYWGIGIGSLWRKIKLENFEKLILNSWFYRHGNAISRK